jgi:4-hydroxy-tetrahydrodipicolinate synthase
VHVLLFHGTPELGEDRVHIAQIGAFPEHRRAFDREPLERATQLVDFFDIVAREAGDTRPSVSLDREQALTLELRKRLAYRAATHAEGSREGHLAQMVAGSERTANDRRAQTIENVVREAAPIRNPQIFEGVTIHESSLGDARGVNKKPSTSFATMHPNPPKLASGVPLTGVFAATVTPLASDATPDLKRLVRYCAWLLAHGCDGINLLGTTGEAASFSVEQRIAVMRAVADAGLPVGRFVVGTGAAAFADTVALTREAFALGYGVPLVIPPFYFKEIENEGVFRYYARLIDKIGEPALRLYLYHFPQTSGVGFDLELIGRIVDAFPQTVVGIKDSSGDLAYARSVASAFPQLAVFPSSETALAGGGVAGFAGCISATVNVTAPIAARVWRERGASQPSDPTPDETALRAMRSAMTAAPLVAAIKHVVAGLFGEPPLARVAPPLVELAPNAAAALDRTLDAIDAYREIRRIVRS